MVIQKCHLNLKVIGVMLTQLVHVLAMMNQSVLQRLYLTPTSNALMLTFSCLLNVVDKLPEDSIM